ncbi:hypothetical protein LIA77_08929 [Sarocladium implicatum]|nr:hypothetical protein LIA77_08929 [Sarocladium implicatum]
MQMQMQHTSALHPHPTWILRRCREPVRILRALWSRVLRMTPNHVSSRSMSGIGSHTEVNNYLLQVITYLCRNATKTCVLLNP